MAIVVETGAGLSNSNSYASVAEADAYFLERANEAWDVVDEKEPLLIKATDFMLRTYGQRWKGWRTLTTQALDWPRSNVMKAGYVDYGPYYEIDELPAEIKNICIELALKASVGELDPDVTADDQIADVKVGPIAVSYKQFSTSTALFRAIEARLQSFLIDVSGSGFARLVRT
jgi:hypothetical protein